MAKKTTNNRIHSVCTRKLKNPPRKACPSALLRIEFVKNGRREIEDLPGCPWYINDALSHYCWFNYAKQKEFGNHTTKEIGQYLAITAAQVEKAECSALEKLGLLKNSEEIKEMKECVADMNYGNLDDTIYAVGSFSKEIIEELGKMYTNSSGETDEK